MAKLKVKVRGGRTVQIEPREGEQPADAASRLRRLVEAAGGEAKPPRYTKRPVSPQPRQPMLVTAAAPVEPSSTPPASPTFEERLVAEGHNRRQLALAYLEFSNVRWVWHQVIAAARKGEASIAAGKGSVLRFGRFGIGQHLVIDAASQMTVQAIASL